MKLKFAICSIVALSVFATPAAVFADTEITGESKGAFYRIVVPDAWNGDLVIWNHGFSLSPVGPVSDLGPLAFPVQLPEGYAVAASSYSQLGWALFNSKKDNEELYKIFKENFGEPNSVIVTGASLGGIVTAQTIERAKKIKNMDGAYPFCGAMGGSRNWDGGFDLRLVYDYACGATAGALPGGATGLPFPGFPTYPLDNTTMALAVHACTGILAPAAFRTPAQAAALDTILSVTTLPENFLLTDMGFATFAMSDLIFDPDKLNGEQGVGNENAVYTDAAVNAGIARVKASKKAANKLRKNFTPTGGKGKGKAGRGKGKGKGKGKGNRFSTKVVSLHTDGDGLVIVENEGNYRDVIPAENLTTAIVDEAGSSHCGFTEAELVAGWESLRAWVAGAPQPSAASIQGTCLGLELLGYATGPCRIDPAYSLGVMDDRIPPR